MICRMMVLRHWRLLATTALLGFCSLWVVAVPASQHKEEDATRRIWNKRFREARDRTQPKRVQKTAPGGELVGVTIWRLSETTTDDNQNPPTAERATVDTPFREGERVRLSIEVPQVGNSHLYVIDREVYADGATGDPYLIFPSQTTPKGGNVVTAGKPVYIPAQGDSIPYFTVQRSRIDQVREKLTIIVSPKPLNITLGTQTDPTKLDRAQVAQWEKQWGGRFQLREDRSSAGKQWTEVEKQAIEGERRLVQGDPLPQTIYHVKARPGAPIMLHASLKIAP